MTNQQKKLALILIIAQIECFVQATNKECLIMIDDIMSELDKRSMLSFLDKIANLKQQIILTAFTENILQRHAQIKSKMFHMKHGEIDKVSYC